MSFLALLLLQSDTLGGEWGGVRTDLAEKGLTWKLAYTGEVLANVHGGLDQGSEYMGLGDLIIDVDFDRLLGWTGGSGRVNPLWISGEGITGEFVGDLLRVSNIEARDGVRIYETWLQQAIGAVAIRGGLLAYDTEFSVLGSAASLVNSAFGALPTLALNEPSPAYPFVTVGGQVAVDFGSGVLAKAAVYEGSPGTEAENERGWQVDYGSDEGLLVVGELAWTNDLAVLKAGFWRHSGGSGTPRWGGYAQAEAELWLGGPVAFARIGAGDEERSVLVWSLEFGASWKGPFASRPTDELVLGIVRGQLGDLSPAGDGQESVVELTYRFVVLPGFVLQPDVQFVRHPSGTGAQVDDAVVVGLRVDLAF